MRSRSVWILVAVFVALAGLASFYTLRQSGSHPRTPYSLVEADSLLRVEIARGDTSIVFERKGNRWELTHPLSYPADQTGLESLCKGLTELELGEIISTNPAKFPTFQVDERNGVEVRAYGREAEPLISVILGKMGRDFQHCYVRFPQGSQVHIARGPSRFVADRKVDDWRDKGIISFEKESAVEIAYQYPKMKGFTLVRQDGKWLLGGKEADSTAVSTVLGLLSNFRADGFRDGGDISPQLTITVTLEDKAQEKVTLGKEEEKGKHLVKREGSETAFWIYSWKVERLRKSRRDFL